MAAAIGIIVLESTEAFGSNHTTGPLHTLFRFLFGASVDRYWDIIHFYIRKSGHFVGYGLVGLTFLRAWRRIFSDASFSLSAALSIACAFLIACADELHQANLPNRTGCFSDVLIDTFGTAVLISAYYLFSRLLFAGKHFSRKVGF